MSNRKRSDGERRRTYMSFHVFAKVVSWPRRDQRGLVIPHRPAAAFVTDDSPEAAARVAGLRRELPIAARRRGMSIPSDAPLFIIARPIDLRGGGENELRFLADEIEAQRAHWNETSPDSRPARLSHVVFDPLSCLAPGANEPADETASVLEAALSLGAMMSCHVSFLMPKEAQRL